MSTENYGAKALCMVCGMGVMVLCSWMLIKAHECCWCHEAMFMCAHGCLWVLMNVHKYSWVWHHGTISTHEHYWGPMATLEHLWALINNIEQSWSWQHGTNSPHERWQAFMSMVSWHNIPLIVPLHHTYHCSWGLMASIEYSWAVLSAHGHSWMLPSDPECLSSWFSNKQKMLTFEMTSF